MMAGWLAMNQNMDGAPAHLVELNDGLWLAAAVVVRGLGGRGVR